MERISTGIFKMTKSERRQFVHMLPRLEKNLSCRLSDYTEVLKTYWMLVNEYHCDQLKTDEYEDTAGQIKELCRDIRIILRKIGLLKEPPVEGITIAKTEKNMTDIAQTHQEYQDKWKQVHNRFGSILHAVRDKCEEVDFEADLP